MFDTPETAYAMLRRGAEEWLCGKGFDVRGDIVSRAIWEALLKKYNKLAREFSSLLVSDPPESVDAGAEILKEEVGAQVDAFAEKFKQKLSQKKEGGSHADV